MSGHTLTPASRAVRKVFDGSYGDALRQARQIRSHALAAMLRHLATSAQRRMTHLLHALHTARGKVHEHVSVR